MHKAMPMFCWLWEPKLSLKDPTVGSLAESSSLSDFSRLN
jgi:hypothetical protein